MDVPSIQSAVARATVGLIICDPSQDDVPIVYVNDGFQKITLYSREYAVGKNCRFLQGKGTAKADRQRMSKAIESAEETTVRVLNYKADGTSFVNQIVISPVFDEDGQLSAFLGVQREVDEEEEDNGTGGGDRPSHSTSSLTMLKEIQHRVKNHLAMVVSLIRLHATRPISRESYAALSHRIEALALLYDELLAAGDGGAIETIEVGAYLGRISHVVAGIDGRPSVRLNVDCEEIDLPVDPAARLGLLLTELLTNAFNHAFENRERGFIQVRLRRAEDNLVCLTVEDDGVGLPEGSEWPFKSDTIESQQEEAASAMGDLDTTSQGSSSGLGGSIVRGLTQALDGNLEVHPKQPGTRISVTLDLDCIVPSKSV